MFDSQKNHPKSLMQALIAGAIVASAVFTAGCSPGKGISAESVAAAAAQPSAAAQKAEDADVNAMREAYEHLPVAQQAAYVVHVAQALLWGTQAYEKAHLQAPPSLASVISDSGLADSKGNFWLPAVGYSIDITTARLAIVSKAVCAEIERHPESGATCAPDPNRAHRNLYAVTFSLQDQ